MQKATLGDCPQSTHLRYEDDVHLNAADGTPQGVDFTRLGGFLGRSGLTVGQESVESKDSKLLILMDGLGSK